MTDVWFGLLFAGILALLGLWGRRNAAALAHPSLSKERRERRERELLRGAFWLLFLAALVLLAVLARVIFAVTH